jgi:FKBP-type peptidyl-prolyl cis-trans isomerase SlpA
MNSEAVAMGDRIALRYAIRLKDNTEFISNFDELEPDSITLGDGTLAPTLEQWLVGVQPGERHVFLLDPWQAFGTSNDALVQTLSPQDIPANIVLEPNTLVEFSLPNGQTLAGTILEISPNGVKVDFNHPLADCPIEFEVEIIHIQKPHQSATS